MTTWFKQRPGLAAVLVLSLAGAPPRAAQQGSVEGTVRSTSGEPIHGASVRVSTATTVTDTAGRFRLGSVPAGRSLIAVRAVGWHPSAHSCRAPYCHPER
ncbi:MAG TPA: carboxypeptidase-like regulatory domain-containing protein, partial [Gemmatimonadales bacterium]